MGKKVLRVEILTEENGTRECSCAFGERAEAIADAYAKMYWYSSIDNMLKDLEKVVVRRDDIEAKRAWER